MKKTVLFLLITGFLFLISAVSIAQSWQARLGMNFSTFNIFDEKISYNHNRLVKPGWNVGGFYEFSPGKLFSLETGLILETKGDRRDNSRYAPSDFSEMINVTSLIYLDLPMMGKLNIPIKKYTFIAAAGPYIGIGIAGWEETITTPETNLDTRSAIRWGHKGSSSYRRFDYGYKVLAGIEYQHFQFSLFHAGGLMDIDNFDLHGQKIRNLSGGFLLGYRLPY